MERRLSNAIVLVEKTKDTQSVFFSDKGVRLTVTEDKAVIATGFHQHVFDAYNMSGMSRPYLYTKRIVELALENDREGKDDKGNPTGYTYAALLETLKKKEDKSEYNIAYYYSWYLLNIFAPLYNVGETEIETFVTYFDYICNIARNAILLDERKEDMTNKMFIEKFLENIKEFTDEINVSVIIPKKSDDEVMQENLDALQEQEGVDSNGN
jgi:hypothetical protein